MESTSSENLSPVGALVRDLARQLVDYPSDLHVVETAGTSLDMLQITVAIGDYGRLVGRNGANSNALRYLIGVMSAKAGRRYILDIPESTREHRPALSETNRAQVVSSGAACPKALGFGRGFGRGLGTFKSRSGCRVSGIGF